MARKFLTGVDLAKNELQNARVQNLASAPSAPVTGQLYYNSGDNTLYWYNGTGWVAAKDAGATSVFYQTLRDDGAARTQRNNINFVTSPTISMALTDDSGNDETEVAATFVPTADVSMAGFKLTNVGAPTGGTDAVTKDYADNLSAGLSWKDAVRIATTANVTQSGLTAIDGVTPIAGDRILCKDQSTAGQNGIFVAAVGAWSRATDADSEAELLGATVFVLEGTANADKAYTMTTNAPITVGTTGLTWVQFGAGTAYSAGNGLTLTGSTFDVVAANGSITVAADNIQVAYAGTGGAFGSAVTAARSDHNHDTTYTKKFSANVGGSTSQALTHNLNTRDVTVDVYRNSTPWDTVECDVERTDANNVTLRFATAPAASEYRAVVVG